MIHEEIPRHASGRICRLFTDIEVLNHMSIYSQHQLCIYAKIFSMHALNLLSFLLLFIVLCSTTISHSTLSTSH